MSSLDDFLFSELMAEHGAELELADWAAPTRAPASVLRHWRTPLLAGLALAGAAVAAILSLAASAPAPAYAVTQNADGSVTVTINELIGVNGVNEELAKLGVKAVVARREAGCTPTGDLVPLPPLPGTDPAQQAVHAVKGSGISEWVIQPGAIPPGDTLSLVAERYSEPGLSVLAFGAVLYRGPAPTCYPTAGE